jgi:hypothetical protein
MPDPGRGRDRRDARSGHTFTIDSGLPRAPAPHSDHARAYTGVLAPADVFTERTTFWVTESIRLDLGYGSRAHP